MLSALISLVASMGALSVLAGIVSGIIFLVDTTLHWSSAQKNWPNVPGRRPLPHLSATNGAARHDVNGLANGKPASTQTARATPAPPTLPPLQTLDAPPWTPRSAPSTPRARSGAGDGESQCDMGEADDVPDGVSDVRDEAPGVRQLMERLVESLVSGGLDDVVLRPKDPHPRYGRIYKRHQPRLRSALTSLAYSLQMAMAQKPLAECETPGRAHAQLRAIILDLARDVAALDRHPGRSAAAHADAKLEVLDGTEDFATRAYEDILATAIVNKVMERSTNRINKRNINNNFVSSLEVRVGSVEDSPESCTSSYTESWTGSGSSHLDHSLEDGDSDPLSLMIEECIEEVTTITASSSPSASSSQDEGSDGEGVARQAPVARRRRKRGGRRRVSGASAFLPALLPLPPSGPPSLLNGLSSLRQRVPFPELGVDIVDGWSSAEVESSDDAELRGGSDDEGWRGPHARPDGAEADEDGVVHANGHDAGERPASCLELVTPMQSWEDNWLFQSKRMRKPATQYAHHPVPVPMLVPNPSEDLRPLIGDVDAEETSDLSECSDDALEEVVLAGLGTGPAPGGPGSDQFSEDLSLSESSARSHLDGLAETCNLELLRRATPLAAPTLSTAPAPHDQRTNRTANAAGLTDSTDRLSPLSKASSRNGDGLDEGLVGRWARDQDAEVTVVYDTPTRREAPGKEQSPARARLARAGQDDDGKAEILAARPTAGSTAETLRPVTRHETSECSHGEILGKEGKAASMPSLTVPLTQPSNETTTEHSKKPVTEPSSQPHVNGQDTSGVSPATDDLVDLFTPPRPGTIAEREHRKWLEATPLANNPYSPENIHRRLQKRADLAISALLAPNVSASDCPQLAPDTSLHIALRVDPDPKKYGRDFYINSRSGDQSGAGVRRSQSSSAMGDPRTSRTSILGASNGLLDISPWSPAVRTNGDGGPEEPSSQTSVRELARQFLNQPQTPTPQVHSLTARSMPREFREGLRHLSSAAGAPRPARSEATQRGPALPLAGSRHDAHDADDAHDDGRPDPEGARQPVDPE